MATPNVGILTNAGKNLIDQVNAGQTKITFSKIVFSSMNNNQLTDDQIKALTTVAPQEIVVNNPEVTLDNNTGETRIRATGNNEALTDGVYVKTYAVYAKDDSSNEILYGITVSPNPNYLPEYDGVTPQAVTYSYKVNISNTSNITFANSNDIYVSDTDLAEALQPYAKTVDVNQQLDKKVNIADMRKPANDVAGIEEVNAKADDSKVVHAADMRKPASDVAGIEEVNTLQTQVDNSAVGTNLVAQSYLKAGYLDRDTGGIVSDGSSDFHVDNYIPTNGSTVFTFSSPDYVFKGSPDCSLAMYDSDKKYLDYQQVTTATQTLSNPNTVYIRFSINFKDEGGTSGGLSDWLSTHRYKLEKGSVATDWCPNPEDKVNVADMRKPANDVAGIEEVNAKQDKLTITPADDSKVAHLSGTNNFDTVPTVNNNPLLLASSLPSDLARLSQDANFTAKLQQNGQDVALANNTLARNPNTGSVSETNTFTAAQTFSIAPTITDASTDKGDNQAATMADLKSIEESAWYIIPEDNNNLIRDIGWIKRDPINKYLYILFNFAAIPWVPSKGDTIINLSKYVDSLSDASGYAMLSSNEWLQIGEQWTLRHTYRVMSTIFASGTNLIVGSGFNFSDPNDGGDYLNLSTFNDNVDQTSWANKTIRVKYNNWIGS